MEFLNEDINKEIDRRVQEILNKNRKQSKEDKVRRKKNPPERNKTSKISENECPHCKEKMERRSHIKITDKQLNKHHYFKEWDYCKKCKFLKHYEEFKVMNPIGRMFEDLEENKKHFFSI